jgi:hypothetical protein
MAFTPVGSPFDLASAGFTLAGVTGRATDDLVVIGTINGSTPSFGAGWTQTNYTAEFGTILTIAFRRYNGVDTLPSVGDGVGVVLRGSNGTPVYAEGVNGDEPSLLVADAAGVVMAVGDLIDVGGITPTFQTDGTTYAAGAVKLFRPSPAGNQSLTQFGAGVNGMLAAFIPFAASAVTITGTAPTAAATATAGELRIPLPISGTAPTAAAAASPGTLSVPSGPITLLGTEPTAAASVTPGSLTVPAIYEWVAPTATQDVQTSAGRFDLNVQILVGTAPEATATVVPGALTGPPVISGTAPEAGATVTPGTIIVAGPVVTGTAPEAVGSVTPGTLENGAVPPVISGAPAEASATVTPGSISIPGSPITLNGASADAAATVVPGSLDVPQPQAISGTEATASGTVTPGSLDVPGTPITLTGEAATASASAASGSLANGPPFTDLAATFRSRPTLFVRRRTVSHLPLDNNWTYEIVLKARDAATRLVVPRTGLSNLTAFFAPTPTAGAIAGTTQTLTEASGQPGTYVATLPRADVNTALTAYAGRRVWEIVDDGTLVRVVRSLVVVRTRIT